MVAVEIEKPDRRVANRREYLRSSLKRAGRRFSLSNGKRDLVNEHPDSGHVGAGGQFYERGEMVYRFNVSFYTNDWSECERIFVSVGDPLQAYSGQITPWAANQTLRWFHSAVHSDPPSPDIERETAELRASLKAIHRQLPLLDEPTLVGRNDSAQPKDLGWINYWSPQTCAYLGFPQAERDGDLLAHSYRTPGGAWLVKLCPEPLDLGRPEHLGIFADTFARLPRLGVRAAGRQASKPPSIGFPQNTAFIHRGEISLVAEQVVSFLRALGFQLVEQMPNGARGALTVGLFPGIDDWTIVKTMPQEFLSRESDEVKRQTPLIELCRALQCEGFMLNVDKEIEATLLEIDLAGRTHVSGFREGDPTGGSAASPIVGFELLPIEVDMLDLDDCGQLAQHLYSEFGGRNADLCDNHGFTASLDGNVLRDRQGMKLFFVPTRSR